MKPLTHCLLLFITLLCLAASCNDDEMPPPPEPIDPDGLPLPTQTGENTFGCLINGEPWIAEIDPGVFDPIIRKTKAKYDEVGVGVVDFNNFTLGATFISLSDSIHDDFSFYLEPILNTGKIKLEELRDNDITFSKDDLVNSTSIPVYHFDPMSSYDFALTKIDTVSNVCSGTFEFLMLNGDRNDTLKITKGRFDVIYQPI